MVKLFVNDILQNISEGKETTLQRVLWIDSQYKNCITIDINTSKGMPVLNSIDDIEIKLINEDLIKRTTDPTYRFINETTLTEIENNTRAKAWQVIQFVAGEDKEPDIFINPTYRRSLIKESCAKFNVSETYVVKYLKKFWQGGKMKNSLLPSYSNCGGKGKDKKCSDKKRGRPSNSPNDKSMNIDENIKIIIKKSLKCYENNKELSLRMTYDYMIQDFFSDKIVDGGEEKYKRHNKVPNYGQFLYWHDRLVVEGAIVKEYVKRKGIRRYNLTVRPVLSEVNSEVLGPGSRFHIDATVVNVRLVNRFNRKQILEKPTLYFTMDVFSRLIPGYYLGHEEMSFLGASMALYNMVEDKVDYCKKYGIQISEDEWPCKGIIPNTLLADRGEIASKKPDNLIENLGMTIELTQSHRGDLKPIVEQHFRLVKKEFQDLLLEGVNKTKFLQRGDKDPKNYAELDIYQLNQIVIEVILQFNNNRIIGGYERSESMIQDEVPATPVKLWEWGIRNISGRLRSVSEDVMKVNLMPKEKVFVTKTGILFHGISYSCETAEKQKWFGVAGIKGEWDIEIYYDSRDISNIYIYNKENNTHETCYILKYREKYEGKSLIEVTKMRQGQYRLKQSFEEEMANSKINYIYRVQKIAKEAKKLTNETWKGTTKAGRIKDMKENTKDVRDIIREEEKFVLTIDENTLENTTQHNECQDDDYYGNKNLFEQIRELNKEVN